MVHHAGVKVAAVMLVLLASCSTGGPGTPDVGISPQEYRVTFHTASGKVEVRVTDYAATDEQRERGLMGRGELGKDDGMLFVYASPSETTFWMKDTLIPLSAAFWDRDGTVHTILDMEPCLVSPCETYAAREPYVYVLEMNVGWFEENGIEVGDRADVQPIYF
jgi:hypothetical protein